VNKTSSHHCGLCGGFHVSRNCPKSMPLGKVTGFDPSEPFVVPEISVIDENTRFFPTIPGDLEPGELPPLAREWYDTYCGYTPETRTTVELSGDGDIEFHKWAKIDHRLKVSEARAMERAMMLGFKIVVSPHLRGTETEIHVSQERYDELKQFLPERETK
jgi:hypothetical protein